MNQGTKVAITRISRGSMERVEIGTWLVQCYSDPVVDPGTVLHSLDIIDAEPTSAARGKAVMRLREQGYGPSDVLIMIDNDMVPPDDFYNRAVRFLHDYPGPNVFACPYRGAAPKRDVQVMTLDGTRRFDPGEAAARRNIEQVGSMGSGLIACNMAVFDLIERKGLLPWFEYTFKDPPFNTDVACTEDIAFCNKLNKAGGRIYCDWESWAGHAKTEIVGKPERCNKVRGWTQGLENFYAQAVQALPDGARFIEVGVFEGRSLILAAQEARRLGKRLRFVAVDHFRGSPEMQGIDSVMQGRVREVFEANLRQHGPTADVQVIALDSVQAAERVEDGDAEFIFLDADHSYESVKGDILAWLPKVKPGGILAGHDWHDFPGVQQAVNELLGGAEVMENCWFYRVPGNLNGQPSRKEVARA